MRGLCYSEVNYSSRTMIPSAVVNRSFPVKCSSEVKCVSEVKRARRKAEIRPILHNGPYRTLWISGIFYRFR